MRCCAAADRKLRPAPANPATAGKIPTRLCLSAGVKVAAWSPKQIADLLKLDDLARIIAVIVRYLWLGAQQEEDQLVHERLDEFSYAPLRFRMMISVSRTSVNRVRLMRFDEDGLVMQQLSSASQCNSLVQHLALVSGRLVERSR